MRNQPNRLFRGILRMFAVASIWVFASAFAAESTEHTYAIPAGDAEKTLKLFRQQSGVQILYSPTKVSGVRTNAVNGVMTPGEALDAMFSKTTLVALKDEKTGTYTVQRAASADETEKNAPRVVQESQTSTRPDEVVQLDAYAVTVDVQKRPQSVQEIPISITSLNALDIAKYHIQNIQDLSRLTPNLLVSSFTPGDPTIAIRGATNTFEQIGVSKPVAVVIDDVFVPRNTAASFELFDLDSVQVLRGPQGTLFGRNVTGGAIVLNTLQPSFSGNEAAAQVTYGNYNDVDLKGYFSGPITDSVAGKVSVDLHTHDGYGRDRLTGILEDNQDSSAIRGQLRIKLSPKLHALISADYSDDRNNGRTLSSEGLGSDGNPRTSELGYPQNYARTMWGVSSHVYLSTQAGDFSSITAYRLSQSSDNYSNSGTSYLYLTSGSQLVTDEIDHPGTFTEELRYTSPKWRHFDFVSGLYYLNENAYRDLITRAFAAGTGVLVTNQNAQEWVDSQSYAVYCDGVVHATNTLDLTLGARYTVDDKQASVIHNDLLVAANNFSAFGLSKQWSELTPRAVLTWTPNKALRIYSSVTKGYTAGGYNGDAAVLKAFTAPFDPETVTNYEVGAKSTFFNNQLRANVAVFRSKYNNKQELYFNTVTRVLNIVNASKATMSGAEIELGYTPVQGFNLTAAYGLLNATYDSFVVPGVLNYTGNRLGSAPKGKMSLSADYEYRLAKYGYLSAVLSYSKTDGYFTGATNAPTLYVPGYSLLNASIGFSTLDRKWQLTFWGHNLANTDFLLTPSTTSVLAEYIGPPRTYGVTLGMRF